MPEIDIDRKRFLRLVWPDLRNAAWRWDPIGLGEDSRIHADDEYDCILEFVIGSLSRHDDADLPNATVSYVKRDMGIRSSIDGASQLVEYVRSAWDSAPQYQAAADILRDRSVVALPTDTVYGLCARGDDAAAVERIYTIKQRDPAQAMPVFVASMQQAETIGVMNDAARKLADTFWPGALTIVVSKQPSYDSRALAGNDSAALRIPGDARLRALCEHAGPLTGTSANIAGREECHTAAEVRAQLGDAVDLIVDAPVDAAGQPSTIVDCTQDPPVIVRQGAIEEASIRRALLQ